jgi:proteasome assembly chaperone (PAC2) family protein
MQQIVSEEQALISTAYSSAVWVRQNDVAGTFVGATGILWLGEAGFAG